MDYRCACGRVLSSKSSLNRHKLSCSSDALNIIVANPNKKQKVERKEENDNAHRQPHQQPRNIRQLQGSDSSDFESEATASGRDDSEDETEEASENTAIESQKSSEDSIYFGEDKESLSEFEEQSDASSVFSEGGNKGNFFPFQNKETALLYLWAHVHPRISTRKLQCLLDVLHTPGFDVQNLPPSTYLLKKVQKKLPTLKIG